MIGGVVVRGRLLVLWALLAISSVASAGTISFTYSGTGSGSIGGKSFTGAAFTVATMGDTSAQSSFSSGFWINHTVTTVNISGVGSYTFSSSSPTYVNSTGNLAGLAIGVPGGIAGAPAVLAGGVLDPNDPSFGMYNELSAMGPVTAPGNLLAWSIAPLVPNGGSLGFDDVTQVTINSDPGTPVPEPGVMILTGTGLLGMGMLFRRRLRRR